MKEYRIVNYFDVWGNPKEGFEVNNLCEHSRTMRESFADHKDIIRFLKNEDFLARHVRENMLVIEWLDEDFIEISIKRDGRPLCRIEGVA